MGSLYNDWIELFDENNFLNLKDEPQGLRSISMLFVTIQKEFQKVEDALSNKLQRYKLSLETKNCMNAAGEKQTKAKSPSKENFKGSIIKTKQNDKTVLKSPTLDRHRKTNLKKIRKPLSIANVSSIKNVTKFGSPEKPDQSCQVISNASDDDIFDSSIIAMTPDIEISKRSQRKRMISRTASSNTTLTQMFSGMNSKEDDKKDEITMMDIEEILQKVENADKMDEALDLFKNPKTSHKITNSFIEDYDRIPDSKKTPVKIPFVYKETVRGNEKKKLKGWSCKECENFYKGMRLSEEELELRMNECSKHRSRFKPDEETIAGYWGLSIPSSSEDEASTPQVLPAISQNSLNESTIYCFFKK